MGGDAQRCLYEKVETRGLHGALGLYKTQRRKLLVDKGQGFPGVTEGRSLDVPRWWTQEQRDGLRQEGSQALESQSGRCRNLPQTPEECHPAGVSLTPISLLYCTNNELRCHGAGMEEQGRMMLIIKGRLMQ